MVTGTVLLLVGRGGLVWEGIRVGEDSSWEISAVEEVRSWGGNLCVGGMMIVISVWRRERYICRGVKDMVMLWMGFIHRVSGSGSKVVPGRMGLLLVVFFFLLRCNRDGNLKGNLRIWGDCCGNRGRGFGRSGKIVLWGGEFCAGEEWL